MLWLALAAVALGGACQKRLDPTGHDDAALVAAARALIDERRPRQAIALLEGQPPANGLAQYWLAQAYFRSGDYALAGNLFKRLLDDDPLVPRLWRGYWLSRLVADRGEQRTRDDILSQVRALLQNHADEPQAALSAYYGYSMLRRHRERAEILRDLLSAPVGDEGFETQLAAAVSERMLVTRKRERRRQLAQSYLDRFPLQRGSALAARTWVRAHESIDIAMALSMSEQYPANRHLKQALAQRLIDDGGSGATVRALLESHVESLHRTREREAQWYWDAQAAATLRRWELGRSQLLLARIDLREGRFDDARAMLDRALAAHPERWRVYEVLAELARARSQPDDELRWLRASLVHGNPRPRAARRLDRQAETLQGWPRAREGYARREGVAGFVDVTESSGLAGVAAERVAWGDYNNDGFDDLLLAGRLFENRAGRSFIDRSKALGLPEKAARGGTWGDADNDGWLDLVLTYRDGNAFYRNHAGRRFDDATRERFGARFGERTESASWGDLDNDGWLDLYLANYELREFDLGVCLQDQLYRNEGGRFHDVSATWRIRPQEPLCGRGAVWSDINGDGRLDILVANYRLDPNLLWINSGDNFEDQAARWGLRGRNNAGLFGHTIAMAPGDVNRDGRQDVFVSNLAHPRLLDYSDPAGLLIHSGRKRLQAAADSGIGFEETSSDALFADIDNDGDLDLFITSVYRGRYSRLFRNEGGGRFRDISWLAGARVENGWGAAVSDFDRDGDLDLVVGSRDGVRLLRNETRDNHWLSIRVRRTDCNVFGIGAKVSIDQPFRQFREIRAGRGTGSQDSATVHFGLGSYPGPLTLRVEDLCGNRTQRRIASVDRIVTVD